MLLVVGAVLIGSGVAGTLGVRRTSTSSLTTGEVVAVIGTGLAALAFSVAEWLPVSPSLVVATLLAAGVAVAARQLRTQVLYLGAAGVTVLAWLSLVAVGLDRLFQVPTLRAEWATGHAWPMLTAAGLVGALALATFLPQALRVLAAGTAGLLVVLTAVAPALDEGPTPITLTAIGALVVAGAATLGLRRAWRASGQPTQVVAGTGLLLGVALQVGAAADRLVEAASSPWAGRITDALGPVDVGLAAPWLLPVSTFVLLATLAVLAETSRHVDRAVGGLPALQVWVGSVLAASVVAALASYPVALWLVVGVLLLLALALTVWSVAGRTLRVFQGRR